MASVKEDQGSTWCRIVLSDMEHIWGTMQHRYCTPLEPILERMDLVWTAWATLTLYILLLIISVRRPQLRGHFMPCETETWWNMISSSAISGVDNLIIPVQTRVVETHWWDNPHGERSRRELSELRHELGGMFYAFNLCTGALWPQFEGKSGAAGARDSRGAKRKILVFPNMNKENMQLLSAWEDKEDGIG